MKTTRTFSLSEHWRSELVWLIAVGIASSLILIANPALEHPWGSNWPHYFESAQFFWDPTSAYFEWRTPMYPFVLATLGRALGFVVAAQLIAQVSVVLLVLATGLLGRALSGPVAGAIAALTLPALQCVVESATWSNMYPLAAAVMASAVAMGAVCARWPTLIGIGLTGVLAALSWRLNHLGLVAIPMALGLACLGVAAHIPLRRMPVWALAAALGLAGPIAIDRWIVSSWDVPQGALAQQVLQRRKEEIERIRDLPNRDDLFPGCTDFIPKPLNLPELTNACAHQVLASNWGTLQQEDCAPPPWILLVLFPLALLPAAWARGRREQILSSIATGLLVGGPAGAIYLGASWTNYSEKYMLGFVPVLAVLAPLAGTRMGAMVGGRIGHRGAGRTAGLIAAALFALLLWPKPSGLQADRPRINRSWEMISGEAAKWARAHVGPDDLLIDCVPLRVDLTLLPEVIPYRFGISTEAPCGAWMKEPPPTDGKVWLLNRAFDEVPLTQPHVVGRYGWEVIHFFGDDHYLWRRRTSEQGTRTP